jgi:uncharacterized membrane protein YgcG
MCFELTVQTILPNFYKMRVPACFLQIQSNDKKNNHAAQEFAMAVHDRWGVGQVTPCGGTGALLFLSVEDRAIYISRGTALSNLLTDSRLDSMIDTMKPYLQQQQYGQAISYAIGEITMRVKEGKPNALERFVNFVEIYGSFVYISVILGFAAWGFRFSMRQKREYARVKSHLTELDQAKAQALQGKFRAVSCPICLENFKTKNVTNSTTGNDDETDDSTQPFLDKKKNPKFTIHTSLGTANNKVKQESKEAEFKEELVGSDGLPLKLLRCGHCFDDTCWNKWVTSGQGNVHKCPICNADVGHDGRDRPPVRQRDPRTDQPRVERPNNLPMDNNRNDIYPRCNSATTTDPTETLRRYRYERLFRLNRLQTLYPQFILPQEVDQWSRDAYTGNLAQDPSFLQRDPVRQSQHNDAWRGSSGASGFGGGSSGGGRGGSW